MRFLSITDPSPSKRQEEPEKVNLLVEVVPKDANHWGVLESLRGTSWEQGVQEVPADALAHALHGRLQPLLVALGRSPEASAKKVTESEGMCKECNTCLIYEKDFCRPGGYKGRGWRRKNGPPNCYEAPLPDGTPSKVLEVFLQVATAWKENRHVIIVKGDGFNLR
jgi:hypothetical protein